MRTVRAILLSQAVALALLPGAAAATVVVSLPPEGASEAAAQAPVQARPGGPDADAPRSDQTVDVPKGTRLLLNNQAGEVTVRSWDRDQVRVQASHSPREQVEARIEEQALRVRARPVSGSRGGGRGLVDYTLTVPRWMPVSLTGTYLEADVEGTTAEVNVETVGGNIRVVGGSSTVTLRSVEGTVTVERTSGKVQANTVNDGIRLVGVAGDVTAETVNGDIELRDLKTTTLDVSTVNGDVTWTGSTSERGTARIATHSGDIRVSLGPSANATVFVRTFQGDFSADFAITLPEGMEGRDGHKRFNFTLGDGSARVELQSFNGDIHVARGPLAERRRGGRGPRTPAVAPAPPAPPVPPVPGAKPPKPPGDAGEMFAASIAAAAVEGVEAALAEAHDAIHRFDRGDELDLEHETLTAPGTPQGTAPRRKQ